MNFSYAGLENHPLGGAINSIVNQNWVSLRDWINPAAGKTGSQSGTAFTASANTFTSDDVGATIRMADGTTDTISAYVSATQVTMTTSQTIGSQAFELYRGSESMSNALARGLIKRPRMIAADDGKVPVWNNSLGRFVMTDPGGSLYMRTSYVASVGFPSSWGQAGDEIELPVDGQYLIMAAGVVKGTAGVSSDACGIRLVNDSAAVLITEILFDLIDPGDSKFLSMIAPIATQPAGTLLYTELINSSGAQGTLQDYTITAIRVGA